MKRVCPTLAVATLMTVTLGVVTLVTVLRDPGGLDFMSGLNLDLNAHLQSVPHGERGMGFHLMHKLLNVVINVPTFLVGFKGDRVTMFDTLNRLGGYDRHVPFGTGIFTPKYRDVLAVTMSPHQPRGPFLGTLRVPEKCLGARTLIFQGTGAYHSEIREILREGIATLSDSGPRHIELVFADAGADAGIDAGTNAGINADGVKRVLIRTLFHKMFQRSLPEETVDVIQEYFKYGATCVLGEDFHKATLGVILNKVAHIREVTTQAVIRTPVGFWIAKLIRLQYPHLDVNETMAQIADGFLFAGLLGTEHLTSHTLERLRSDPGRYQPMWNQNKTAFLLEQARLDPPVTSVTSLLPERTEVTLRGLDVSLEALTPNQLGLSTANRDPLVWGDRYHSLKRALEFDPTRPNLDQLMSWNGPLHAVRKGLAPRGCPAHRLSMAVAEKLVDHFHRAGHAGQDAGHVAGHDAGNTKPEPSWSDRLGYLLWLVTCAVGAGHLYLSEREGARFSGAYTLYLGAQVGVALGYLLGNTLLRNQTALLASMGYILLFLEHKREGGTLTTGFQKLVAWGVYILYATTVLFLHIRFDLDGSVLVYPFYGVGALCGLYTVIDAGRRDVPLLHLRTYEMGTVGALAGVLDLGVAYIPVYGTLISRVLDSLLYVPLVIPMVRVMDTLARSPTSAPHVTIPTISNPNPKKRSRWTPLLGLCMLVLWVAFTVRRGMDLRDDQVGAEYLNGVDGNFRLMFKLIDPHQIPADASDPHNIKIPEWEHPLRKKTVYPNIHIPIDDEDFPQNTWVRHYTTDCYFSWVSRNGLLFPIPDLATQWPNLTEAREIIGSLLSSEYNTEPTFMLPPGVSVTSDQALTQLAFAGLGAMDIRRVSGGSHGVEYMADFSWLGPLEVRPGFYPYGATAYFNAGAGTGPGTGAGTPSLTRISFPASMGREGRVVYVGDPEWEFAKWVWKCSMLTGVTLKTHLTEIHMLYANFMTMIVREHLPRDHPLRRLIKPFNYRTVHINYGASHTLMTELGLLHRSTAFTWKGLTDGFNYLFSTVRYNSYPERFQPDLIAELGDDYPFGLDGRDYYEVVHRFVTSYIEEYYPADGAVSDEYLLEAWRQIRMLKGSKVPEIRSNTELAKMITNYIVYVTAIHKIVGDVVPYLYDPEFMASKIRPNVTVADIETTAYEMLIARSTITNVPMLMNDFTHLLLRDSHLNRTKEIFDDFQRDLAHLSTKVHGRNARRRWRFNGFDPKIMASSVSS